MEIRVYLNTDLYVEHKPIFCQRVNRTNGVVVPYDMLETSLRFVFGAASVVEFISIPNCSKL